MDNALSAHRHALAASALYDAVIGSLETPEEGA